MKFTQVKWTTVVIALSMLAVLMSGCGTNDKDGSQPASVTSAGDDDDSVKSALKFDYDDKMDLGGRELTISAWGEPPAEGSGAFYDRRYALERRTEEKYKVDIKWVSSSLDTFAQDVALAFSAGKKHADLMFCPSYYGFEIAQLGAIIPLDDYIDYTSPYYAMTANNLKYVDGLHYSYMPDEYSVNSLGYFITYNTALLDKAGCEDPWTLYEEGKWDWDAFARVVEKATMSSGGSITQWGVGGSNLLDALCLSNGCPIVSMKNNKFECGLYTDAGMNALNFLKKLTYEFKGSDGQYGGHNSRIMFGDNKTAMLVSTTYYPGRFISSGMPVMSVPMPKGPDAAGYVNGLEMQEWWVVSAVSDFTPQQLVQVALDMNENDPAYEDTYFSEQGKRDNFVARLYDGNVFTTEEEAEFFFDFIMDKDVPSILNLTTSDLQAQLTQNIYKPISGGEDPRTVLERVRPVINEALLKMLPDRLK